MQYETHIVSSSQPLLLLSPCTYADSVKYTHKQNYECEREREEGGNITCLHCNVFKH